jgi:DNA repair exonuclease SbcCD ATPase subunit
MTTTETGERKRAGRPRKYGQGRITSTVRHTPQLYAELKAAAEEAGRSISEQVEFELEELRRVGPKLDKLDRDLEAYKADEDRLVEKYEAKIKRLEGTIEAFKTTLEALVKLVTGLVETQEHILAQLQADRVATDERIARTVADAVAHAFERRK